MPQAQINLPLHRGRKRHATQTRSPSSSAPPAATRGANPKNVRNTPIDPCHAKSAAKSSLALTNVRSAQDVSWCTWKGHASSAPPSPSLLASAAFLQAAPLLSKRGRAVCLQVPLPRHEHLEIDGDGVTLLEWRFYGLRLPLCEKSAGGAVCVRCSAWRSSKGDEDCSCIGAIAPWPSASCC